MWRSIFSTGIALYLFFPVSAQVTKQFSVEDKKVIEDVNLSFKVNAGYCLLNSGNMDDDLISVYSNKSIDEYSHTYSKEIKGSTCNVDLALSNTGSESLSQQISYSMFGGEKESKSSIWKVKLHPSKPYRLNLNYGIGMANVDLSGLSIKNLKLYSGNADVKIDYNATSCNLVEMDTFFVQVNMGSVVVKKVNLYKADFVLADVGFGNLYLDFSDVPTKSSKIKGSVGAGKLHIKLPDKNTPMIINVKDSWFCKVRLTDDFEKIDEDTYVNTAYSEDLDNVLTFDLDVSMGSITFQNAD